MPGFAQRLLAGAGRGAVDALPAAERAVTESGFALPKIHAARGGAERVLSGLKNLAVGERPTATIKQRFMQGGLLGRGGVLRGSMAVDPAMAETFKLKGLIPAIKEHPGSALGAGLNTSFLAGIPTYAAYKHRQQGQPMARDVIDGLAWTAAAPFSLAAPAIVGGVHGLTDPFLQKSAPPVNYPPDVLPSIQVAEDSARFSG